MPLKKNPVSRACEPELPKRKNIPAVVNACMASSVLVIYRLEVVFLVIWLVMAMYENIAAMKKIAPNVMFPHLGRYCRMNSNNVGMNKIPCARSEMTPTMIKAILKMDDERI